MASIHVEEPVSDDEINVQAINSQQINTQTQQQETSVRTVAKRFKRPSNKSALIALVVVMVFGGFALKSNADKRQLQEQLSSQQQSESQSAEDEATTLKKAISKFIELPSDETPTVATVVDVEKVRGQAFFRNAANNDKVLLFATAGKAILYRPSSNKIIEIAPINLGQDQGQAAQGETPPKSN